VAVCIVSGASGLVGRAIVSQLERAGHTVQPWKLRLGETPAFVGVDVFIHCAWDLKVASWSDIERVNINGSITWFDAAHQAGVKKLIFISSVSAYTGCRSMYGRSKLRVEAAVSGLGGVNVRPGIVHGDPTAGVYGRLWQSTNASFIPLIDGGQQRMLTVHREDLARAIASILDNYSIWKGRTVVVGYPELITLRALLERMLAARGRSARFLSVPSKPVMLALQMAERTGVRLPFRSDSLVTLVGEEPTVDRAALQELKVNFRSLDDALKS
jgi:nucleoside-diphosphate-sugar epimerase